MKEEIKVTNINGVYHIRYFVGGSLKSEYACELKEDIGFTSREMLRWQHKTGNVTEWTASARSRHNSDKNVGKYWMIK
jgi:hypothetical protein